MDIILADTHGPILGKAQATPNLSLMYLATYAKSHRPDLQFHYIPYSTWAFAVPVQGAELYDIARRHGIIDEDFYPSDDWDIFDHLPDTSKRTFNRHYAAARRLQMLMALRSGHLEWRNWKGISHKFMTTVWGKTDAKVRARDEESLWATPPPEEKRATSA